jgi:hypothetical protein
VAFTGLAGLESQDRSSEPHPVVGRVVHSSHRAVFGWWLSYLSSPPSDPVLSVAWRKDGACFEAAVPLVLAD